MRIEPNCPTCGEPLQADYVDIGVGEEKCGPYFCDACGWVEPPWWCRKSWREHSASNCDCPKTVIPLPDDVQPLRPPGRRDIMVLQGRQ